jgi:hypothetical protein
MSQHWNIMRQKTLSSQGESVNDILKRVTRTNPALARQLQRLNWAIIRKEVACRAIARAKTQLEHSTGLLCEIRAGYDNSTRYHTGSGEPPNGECVGVLCLEDVQLGVAIHGTQLLVFWNGYSQECHSSVLDSMMQALNEAYRIEAYKAMMQLVGEGVPSEQTTRDGLVVLSARLREEG